MDCLRDALAAGPVANKGRARGSRDQTCLELEIRPARNARIAAGAFLLLCALAAWRLQYQRALLPSAMVAMGGAAMGWGLWQLLRNTATTVRRVRLHPDGRAVLVSAGGDHAEAALQPCSLRLGRHVLLIFRISQRRRVRLLLGPGMLSAQDLAALGRWLQRLPRGGPGAGVLG